MRKLMLVLLLAACGPAEVRPMDKPGIGSSRVGSYTVRMVGSFHDSLAYNSERGVYELTDSDGRKWVGISGIGIAEVGSHLQYNAATKTSMPVKDER